jgi:hypothetical protein
MESGTARRPAAAVVFGLLLAATAAAQPVPKPFPTPAGPVPATQAPPPAPAAAQPPSPAGQPDEAALGVPVYPGASFLASYDAGFGQRYYLYGTNASYDDIVNYYKVVLKSRGEQIFDEPATHMFEIGRFREDSMAFPPSVTVKDYTWNGSEGYLQVSGATAKRFRTVIQIVPAVE